MARSKKTSKIVEEANTRLAGLKSIEQNLDLGNGLKNEIFAQMIEATANSLSEYNTTLSLVDEKLNLYTQNEKELKDFHERMLLAVGAKYGKNSNEYEKAGGTKKSDRKKISKTTEKKVA
ncbi:MAG: hypothetical protein MUC29_00140 [Pyrinomonadaceae bacterium]|jgi:hypothetical protein|nr:hypothetical protein [Pyrinomonadaceae bacterium]